MASGLAHRRLALNGMSIFYREAGRAGAPVLLLPHGYPCSSFQFRRLMPALADQWRTIAFDWPGFGYSDTPDPSEFAYDFDAYETCWPASPMRSASDDTPCGSTITAPRSG